MGLELMLNNAINFIENNGLTEDFIEWLPKAERDIMRRFIETGEFNDES